MLAFLGDKFYRELPVRLPLQSFHTHFYSSNLCALGVGGILKMYLLGLNFTTLYLNWLWFSVICCKESFLDEGLNPFFFFSDEDKHLECRGYTALVNFHCRFSST